MSSRLFGMAIALTLHLLALDAFIRQYSASVQLPRQSMPFGADQGSLDGFRSIAYLLDYDSEQERSEPDDATANPIVLSPITFDSSLLAALDSFETLSQTGAEKAALVNPVLGDPSQGEAFERMRGIYFSQIQARVGRLWEKPPSTAALSADTDCTALVLQDPDGYVLEVELASCPDDPSLQQSIVRAVYRASPLPAPPEPSVFVQRIHIAFDLM